MRWPSKKPKRYLECNDLFIVTSCTNPADNSEAVNHNLEHSQWQRGEELLTTFSSIRKHYPKAHIVNLENSRIDTGLAAQLQSQCDQWRDYSTDAVVLESRKFENKGIPWLIKILKFLYEEGDHMSAIRVHMLVGRYALTENTLARWQYPGAVFRYFPLQENCSTRYFAYYLVDISKIRAALERTLRPMIFSCSIEDVIHRYGYFEKHYLAHIAVTGMVNGKEFIDE